MLREPRRPNDICTCGSGKLFKQCCQKLTRLPKNASQELQRRYWRKIVADTLDVVTEFAEEIAFFDDFLADAADEYSCEERNKLTSTLLTPGGLLEENFHTWMLFDYYIELPNNPNDTEVPRENPDDDEPHAVPVAILALADNTIREDSDRGRAVSQLLKSPMTFYKVVSTRPGESLVLQDILLDRTITVLDISASRSAKPGWILYTKVLHFDGIAIMASASQIPLAPTTLEFILRLRDVFQSALSPDEPALTNDHIHALSEQIRKSYLVLASSSTSPRPPILHNTDGDPLEPRTVRYTLHATNLAETANRLHAHINTLEDPPPVEIVDTDAEGEPSALMVPWVVAGSSNAIIDTVLIARFVLRSGILEASVNSTKRATRAKQVIQDVFGKEATFLGEEIDPTDLTPPLNESASLELDPIPEEIAAAITARMKQLEDCWIDTPIPALRDMTPRQASKDPQRRELLEALLNEYEHRSEVISAKGMIGYNVPELRARLGLVDLS